MRILSSTFPWTMRWDDLLRRCDGQSDLVLRILGSAAGVLLFTFCFFASRGDHGSRSFQASDVACLDESSSNGPCEIGTSTLQDCQLRRQCILAELTNEIESGQAMAREFEIVLHAVSAGCSTSSITLVEDSTRLDSCHNFLPNLFCPKLPNRLHPSIWRSCRREVKW